MTAIGPGDFVECVDAARAPTLTLGGVYVVLHVWDDVPYLGNGPLGSCLDLVGVPRMPPDLAYDVGRFRPIYRPRVEFIESLLTAKPVRVGEDA